MNSSQLVQDWPADPSSPRWTSLFGVDARVILALLLAYVSVCSLLRYRRAREQVERYRSKGEGDGYNLSPKEAQHIMRNIAEVRADCHRFRLSDSCF